MRKTMSKTDRARLRQFAGNARREARNEHELFARMKFWSMLYTRRHGFDEDVVRAIAREFLEPAH